MRLACGRLSTAQMAHRHSLCHLPPFAAAVVRHARRHCSSAASAAAAAAAAVSAPPLASPGAPLPHLFHPNSTAVPSPSVVVLRTGYAPMSGDGVAGLGGSGAAPAAPSFAVMNTAAFERLIAEALRLSPATLEAGASPSPSSAPATLVADHTVRELQTLLAHAEHALAPRVARKAQIDKRVYGVYLPLLKYGTFTLFAVQFAVYFNWIFFVFDWNLVEPTTYFIAYTGVFCSLVYHYYRCGEDGFTWRNVFQHLARRKAERAYAKARLDVDDMTQLQRRVQLIKDELAHMSV